MALCPKNAGAVACATEGEVQPNGGKLEYCDGSNWRSLGAPNMLADNAACDDQFQVFNTAGGANRMEFCNNATRYNYVMKAWVTPNVCENTGEQQYDFGSHVMQYCDGAHWINMGSVAAKPVCPQGFIPVPGDSYSGTQDFCVSKYHMKPTKITDGTLIDGIGLGHNSAYFAQSRMTNLPWTGFNFNRAWAACDSLNASGITGYHLITNPEWMTIAKEIEEAVGNWSSGVVGSGHIPTGHSDGEEFGGQTFLAASTDNDGCFGTGNLCNGGNPNEFYQKRTFNLSNGEIIWDMAGNVNSWVSPDLAGSSFDYNKDPCNDNGTGNLCVQEIDDFYNFTPIDKYKDINIILHPEVFPTPPSRSRNYIAFLPYHSLNVPILYGGALDRYGFGVIDWESGGGTANNMAMYRGGWYGEHRAVHTAVIAGNPPTGDAYRKFVADGNTKDRRGGIYSAWIRNKVNDNPATHPELDTVGFRCSYTPPN